jgi:hypothetical protein
MGTTQCCVALPGALRGGAMAAAGSLGPRKLSDLDPRVAAAFQSHGQASLALREGVRSARFAAYAVALRWLGHGLLPWCVRRS